MVRSIFLIISVAITSLFAGCAQNDPNLTGIPKESAIPWNRPADWEGAGALGGIGGDMGSR